MNETFNFTIQPIANITNTLVKIDQDKYLMSNMLDRIFWIGIVCIIFFSIYYYTDKEIFLGLTFLGFHAITIISLLVKTMMTKTLFLIIPMLIFFALLNGYSMVLFVTMLLRDKNFSKLLDSINIKI